MRWPPTSEGSRRSRCSTLCGLVLVASSAGAPPWALALLALLGLVPASDISVSLVHRMVPALLPPRKLPKLELAEGVPAELRTLVAVPTLLTNGAELEEQLERLEVHYLANPEGELHFALLTDWADADHEHAPGDDELAAALDAGIERLNAQYEGPPGGGARFLRLHRRRLWNEREGKWIGWERKRGKLHELNRLLRGATDTTFVPIQGRPPAVPEGVRYVITLDADTRLPKGAAYRLVGAMAHPLNRPRFDPRAERVVDGYAVLQPRITPSLPTGPASTTYQRIVSGPGGVDPYAAADLRRLPGPLRRGVLHGKGHLRRRCLREGARGEDPGERAPESRSLRGLVRARRAAHRRGSLRGVSLQLRGRCAPPTPLGAGRLAAPPLDPGPRARTRAPAPGRWKMIDNLRRSLAAPASLLLALAAWTLPVSLRSSGPACSSDPSRVPSFIPVLDGIVPRRLGHLQAQPPARRRPRRVRGAVADVPRPRHAGASGLARCGRRGAHARAALRHEAEPARMGPGRARGLRSRSAASRVLLAPARRRRPRRPRGCARRRGRAGSLAAGHAVRADVGAVAGLLLAHQSAAEARRGAGPLAAETRTLRLLARRTWRFFETFVVEIENFLPPDNFQEVPEPVIARRTSPTNMGLYLLSTTVAHDFGAIGALDMAKRLEDTLETMSRLRRFRGHFFNWYDTRDLRVLDPEYVSTVDSGNLAGHLLAVAQACHERVHRPRFGPETLEGIGDALELLLEAEEAAARPRRAQTVTGAHLRTAAEAMAAALEDPPTALPGWARRLEELSAHAENLLDIARTLANDADARGPVRGRGLGDERARLRREPRARPRRGAPLERRLSAIASTPNGWSRTWTSGSSSMRRGSCSPSAIARRKARSTPTATTCSPPRRGWAASWPSPRAMSRRGTGSCWAGRSRPLGEGPPSSPGRAPCSST